MTEVLQELEKLSISERLLLVEDLWDSIARSNANIPMPQWQKQSLDERKLKYLNNPDSGMEWEQVKQDILNSQ